MSETKPSLGEQIAAVQAAIAAQEALRAVLGDGVVQTTLAALRAELDALQAQQDPDPPDDPPASPATFTLPESYVPPQQAARIFRQAHALAQPVPTDDRLGVPPEVRGRLLFMQGRFVQAQEHFAEAAEALEKAGNWRQWIPAVGFLGAALAARGHCLAGLVEVERALAHARETGQDGDTAVGEVCLAFLRLMGGEWEQARAAACAGIAAAEKARHPFYRALGLICATWAEIRLGNPQAAAARMRQIQELSRSLSGLLLGVDWMVALGAEIALAAGRMRDARIQAEDALAVAEAADGLLAAGLAQRVWGLALAAGDLPRWDEVEAHLTASVTAFEAGDARLEAARTQVAWATRCRDCGDREGAHDHLELAARQFTAAHLYHELDRIRDLRRDLAQDTL